MTPDISAIICTYRRPHYLRKALQSLAGQSLGVDQYEVLVVDNDCSEITRQILPDFEVRMPVRYTCEPAVGLSRARNTGWRNARADIVAYMDDDCIASPTWLASLLDAFATSDPRPHCVGGKVIPIWDGPTPCWLSSRLQSYLGLVDKGTEPLYLANSAFLGGGNLALRKACLRDMGGFSESLGHMGRNLLSGEETLLIRRLQGKGSYCLYTPDAVVWHHSPPSRMTKSWFLRRAFWGGVSESAIEQHLSPPRFADRAIKVARSMAILAHPRSSRLLFGSSDDPTVFTHLCSRAHRAGRALGWLYRIPQGVT